MQNRKRVHSLITLILFCTQILSFSNPVFAADAILDPNSGMPTATVDVTTQTSTQSQTQSSSQTQTSTQFLSQQSTLSASVSVPPAASKPILSFYGGALPKESSFEKVTAVKNSAGTTIGWNVTVDLNPTTEPITLTHQIFKIRSVAGAMRITEIQDWDRPDNLFVLKNIFTYNPNGGINQVKLFGIPGTTNNLLATITVRRPAGAPAYYEVMATGGKKKNIKVGTQPLSQVLLEAINRHEPTVAVTGLEDKYKQGDTLTLQITASDQDRGDKASLRIVDIYYTDFSGSTPIRKSVPSNQYSLSNGILTWKIPANAKPEKYTLEIQATSINPFYGPGGWSNKYVQIVVEKAEPTGPPAGAVPTPSNSNFLIAERDISSAGSTYIYYDIFNTQGKLITSFVKVARAGYISPAPHYESYSLPDASPNNNYLIHGYLTYCTASSSGCAGKQVLEVKNAQTGELLHKIDLRNPNEDKLKGVRFRPGTEKTIEVTYQSGDVENYDAETGLSKPLIPPATTANVTKLPQTRFSNGLYQQFLPGPTSVAPSGSIAAVSGLNGDGNVSFHYETKTGGWAGGGLTFDNFASGVWETSNLSGLDKLVVGLKGNPDRVKFEIQDDQQKRAIVYLSGIRSDQEQFWTIPMSSLQGINLAKVRLMYFIVEGENKTGDLAINFDIEPTATSPISPSTTLTTADITRLPETTVYGWHMPEITQIGPTGTYAAVGLTQRGMSLDYRTGSGNATWAGAGLSYDFFGTESTTIETADLSGLKELRFGLKGTTNRIKLELVDDKNQKTSIHLDGIRSDKEQVWSIPVSSMQGIDYTKVRLIYFIVEGANLTGTLEINRLPTAPLLPVPEGWTRTDSNLNYARRVTSEGPTAYAKVLNLATGKETVVGAATDYRAHVSIHDVSPDGKAAIVFYYAAPGYGLSNVQVKSIHDSTKLERIDGVFQSVTFQNGNAIITTDRGTTIVDLSTFPAEPPAIPPVPDPIEAANAEYKVSAANEISVQITPLLPQLGQAVTLNLSKAFRGVILPENLHLTGLRFVGAHEEHQVTVFEASFKSGDKAYILIQPAFSPSESIRVKAERGILTPDQKRLIQQDLTDYVFRGYNLVVRDLEGSNFAGLTTVDQYVFPIRSRELFPIDRTVVSNQYVLVSTLNHVENVNALTVIDMTGTYFAIKNSQISVPAGEDIRGYSFVSGSIENQMARIRFDNGKIYQANLASPTITWTLVGQEETPLEPITEAGLIEEIRTEILAGENLQSVQGIETGHPNLVAAVAIEEMDNAGNQPYHVFIYSTEGRGLLRVSLNGSATRHFGGLFIDHTTKLAMVKEVNDGISQAGVPWLGSLLIFSRGAIDQPFNAIGARRMNFSPERLDLIDSTEPNTTQLTLQTYSLTVGTELIVGVNQNGGLQVIRENNRFVPLDVLATLPRAASNNGYVIEEKARESNNERWWNVYTTEGQFMTDFRKFRINDQAVKVTITGLDLPDVSPGGKYAIVALRVERDYRTGQVETTQIMEVVNLLTGRQPNSLPERTITLQPPSQGIVEGIHFTAPTIAQVTYSNRVANYDVTTGEEIPQTPPVPAGYTLAASNSNFAFKKEVVSRWSQAQLKLINLQTGQIDIIFTARIGTDDNPDFFFKIQDVSPSGEFTVFTVSNTRIVQIQRVDNKNINQGIVLDLSNRLIGIEWTTLASGEPAVVLIGNDQSRQTVNLRTVSNPNFAFRVDASPQSVNLQRLHLMNLQTGETQILATNDILANGDQVFNRKDVSPATLTADGEWVAFQSLPGKVRLQKINDPNVKIEVSLFYTLQRITWTQLASGDPAAILQDATLDQFHTVNLRTFTITSTRNVISSQSPDGRYTVTLREEKVVTQTPYPNTNIKKYLIVTYPDGSKVERLVADGQRSLHDFMVSNQGIYMEGDVRFNWYLEFVTFENFRATEEIQYKFPYPFSAGVASLLNMATGTEINFIKIGGQPAMADIRGNDFVTRRVNLDRGTIIDSPKEGEKQTLRFYGEFPPKDTYPNAKIAKMTEVKNAQGQIIGQDVVVEFNQSTQQGLVRSQLIMIRNGRITEIRDRDFDSLLVRNVFAYNPNGGLGTVTRFNAAGTKLSTTSIKRPAGTSAFYEILTVTGKKKILSITTPLYFVLIEARKLGG